MERLKELDKQLEELRFELSINHSPCARIKILNEMVDTMREQGEIYRQQIENLKRQIK